MLPGDFEYHKVTTVDEALGLMGQYGDEAKIIAGGHSLIPLMKLRLAEPKHLIDIGNIAEMKGVRRSNGSVSIGALTTHYMIESEGSFTGGLQVLPEAATLIGDVQVRNRGTVGGSVAHADPASDLPAVLVALDAEFIAKSSGGGERTISSKAFFEDLMTTTLGENEILTEVRFHVPAGGKVGSAYEKLANKASHYSVVGAAVIVSLAGDGTVENVSVALSGVAAKPIKAAAVEAALKGKQPTAEAIAEAASHAAEDVDFALSDIHASEEYRLAMTKVMTKRALMRAVERAQA